MEVIDREVRVQALEKENRILHKKLERSESNRVHLENTREIQEKHLNQVILELEYRNEEMQSALKELQSMQTKMVESEKMSALGVLVAGIAHEINNPINFIHGNIAHAKSYFHDLIDILETYRETYPQPTTKIQAKIQELDLDFIVEDSMKLLDSMIVGSDRIRNIVLSLRTFSRLDEAEFKEANLHEGIDSTLMILQHRLKSTGDRPAIEVSKDYGNFDKVPCFAGQLNQVFMNILSNAIDALREHGIDLPRIWIRTFVRDAWVFVHIGNNGPVISESVRARLFDPFFTTKPIGKGTGLGLSISYQIVVDRHKGKLTCHSSPEMGTEFAIEIPLIAY